MLKRPALFLFACTLLGSGVGIFGQQVQMERVRQLDFDAKRDAHGAKPEPATPLFTPTDGGDDLDSFGIQQMLVTGAVKAKYFRVFGEVSGFATNNVGLSRRDAAAQRPRRPYRRRVPPPPKCKWAQSRGWP